MMYVITGWIALFILILYLGNVLGCLILCETVPELCGVRHYIWSVPILNCGIISVFFLDLVLKRQSDYFRKFIKMPQKNMITLYAIARTLEEKAEKEPQPSLFRHIGWSNIANSYIQYGKIISTAE